MLENLEKYELILASGSPRRKELLEGLGLTFEVKTLPGIDESFPSNLVDQEIPQFIARNKAKAYRKDLKENQLVITADTIVSLEGEVLGKPKDALEAKKMLRQLSDKHHDVITGVSLTTVYQEITFSSITHVVFDALTEDEIDFYVDCCNPLDKAGAYGIQEWIGHMGVKAIEGSYFNVMGLPVHLLYQQLKKIQ